MKKIAFLALAVFAVPLVAQVTVKRVRDSRTSGKFFAELTITMELANVKSADVAASRILVTAATDDLGADLINTEKEPQLEINQATLMSEPPQGPVQVTVSLKNPSRKAKMVKEVRGDVELFMPSKDPNSVAIIPKFLSSAGKTLSHKALKANGVEIALLSKAQIEAEKKKMGDEKRKEMAGYGYSGDELEEAVKSNLEYRLRVEEGELVFRIKDPNKRIQEIVYLAGAEEKRVSMSEDEGFIKFSTWGEAVRPDWSLRIRMLTPKNLVKQSFALKDVALP